MRTSAKDGTNVHDAFKRLAELVVERVNRRSGNNTSPGASPASENDQNPSPTDGHSPANETVDLKDQASQHKRRWCLW